MELHHRIKTVTEDNFRLRQRLKEVNNMLCISMDEIEEYVQN